MTKLVFVILLRVILTQLQLENPFTKNINALPVILLSSMSICENGESSLGKTLLTSSQLTYILTLDPFLLKYQHSRMMLASYPIAWSIRLINSTFRCFLNSSRNLRSHTGHKQHIFCFTSFMCGNSGICCQASLGSILGTSSNDQVKTLWNSLKWALRSFPLVRIWCILMMLGLSVK